MFGCVESDVSPNRSLGTKLTVNGWIIIETASKRISRTVSTLYERFPKTPRYSEIRMSLRRRFFLILTTLFLNSFHGVTSLVLPEERTANR